MKYNVLKPLDDTFLESQNRLPLQIGAALGQTVGRFLQQPPKAASVDLYKNNHIYDIDVHSNHRDLQISLFHGDGNPFWFPKVNDPSRFPSTQVRRSAPSGPQLPLPPTKMTLFLSRLLGLRGRLPVLAALVLVCIWHRLLNLLSCEKWQRVCLQLLRRITRPDCRTRVMQTTGYYWRKQSDKWKPDNTYSQMEMLLSH